MGKDKEKDPVDEALDESFPASDPPSWTASPPSVTPPLAALPAAARAVARQLTRVSPDLVLWSGLALAATSLGLLAAGQRRAGTLTGMCAAPALLAALYRRVARSAPADRRATLH